MKVYFKTFGCRTNIYDTALMKSSLESGEVAQSEAEAEVVVVNSCTVTNGADADVRNYINRASRNGKKVVLAGCGSVSRGRELYESGVLWGVVGGEFRERLGELFATKKPFFALGDLNATDKRVVSDFSDHTKAFVKIQEGCDFACSYCIIPQVRGKSRSVEMSVIKNEVSNLVSRGFSEIVLTGTNIGSFKPSLGILLAELSRVKGLKRLRLGSVEPSQIDEAFLEVMNESFLERHLHIALQHTSDEMLRLMRRRNRVGRDLELFESLASKGFALGTDYIVAHPGESEAVWSEAVANLRLFPLTHVHAFVYSPRSNTRSAELYKSGSINGSVAKERLNEVCSIVSQKNFEFRQKCGALSVLVEKKEGEFWCGFDQFYNKTYVKSDENLAKKWVSVSEFDALDGGNFARVFDMER